jgi:hypothetical protein
MDSFCDSCGMELLDYESICTYCGNGDGLQIVEGTYDPKTDAAWKEGWESQLKSLAASYTENRWNLGKAIDEGYQKFGEWIDFIQPFPGSMGMSYYSYASSITGLTPGHLKDLRSTWVRWQEFASVRTDKLSWSHHRVLINEVKEVTEPVLKEWVDKAVENEWSVGDLLKELKKKGGPKPSKDTHTFEVTVPKRTWGTLKRLGATINGPGEAATNILINHCDDPAVQQISEVYEEQAKEKTHEARAKHGRRTARAYDPLGLQRD